MVGAEKNIFFTQPPAQKTGIMNGGSLVLPYLTKVAARTKYRGCALYHDLKRILKTNEKECIINGSCLLYRQLHHDQNVNTGIIPAAGHYAARKGRPRQQHVVRSFYHF